MKVRTLLVDDEKHNLDNLSTLLETHCKQVLIVGTACSVEQAASILTAVEVDLLLLDIHMPHKDGFELLKMFEKPSFETVFVTAHDNYALKAIKFSALDYLLRPIHIEELKAAIEKVMDRVTLKQKEQGYQHLMNWVESRQPWDERRIGINSSKETRFIRVGDVIRCESMNNYTTLHLTNGEKLTSSRPIFEYEEMLEPAGFLRIHQSHLVNKKMISSFRKHDGGYLLMEDGAEIPVSKLKKDLLKSI